MGTKLSSRSFRAARECTVSVQLMPEEVLIATSLLPRLKILCTSGGSEHRGGSVLGGEWVRCGEVGVNTRGNTSSRNTALPERIHPLRSSALKERLLPVRPDLYCSHREACFCAFHAELRDNGGIRHRRGRAVVRPTGPGAG